MRRNVAVDAALGLMKNETFFLFVESVEKLKPHVWGIAGTSNCAIDWRNDFMARWKAEKVMKNISS